MRVNVDAAMFLGKARQYVARVHRYRFSVRASKIRGGVPRPHPTSGKKIIYDVLFSFLATTSSRLVPKSFKITVAAFRPGIPVTEPPGAVHAPVW